MSVDFYFRLAGMVICGVIGWQVGASIGQPRLGPDYVRGVLALTLLGAGLGLLLAPYVTTVPFRLARDFIRSLPGQDLFAGIVGMIIGLIMSALLALPLSSLPEPFNRILPAASALLLAYTGAAVMVMRERELFDMIFRSRLFGEGGGSGRIVVDTSAIIDGRIAEIAQTGFLQGTLIVPIFVVGELQQLADSSDPSRRQRGRHGLDVLERLKTEQAMPVEILESDYDKPREVDAKLVKLARLLRASIVTTDYNLNKVARIQNVPVLNINDLANAVRTPVYRGQELHVEIVQPGKSPGQGVGHLIDGTMVVVEGGRSYLNEEIDVIVTDVVQSSRGQLVFATPKAIASEAR